MGASELPEPLRGLPKVTSVDLARVEIRTRERGVALSAWRLSVRTENGDGAITLVDGAGAESFRRGDGLFLGWDQTRLASVYGELLPQGGRAQPDPGQFG